MNPFTTDNRVIQARLALTGHALLDVYDDLPPPTRIDLADAADRLVEDVAATTQERSLLRGEPETNQVLVDAIYANALCMLIRWETATHVKGHQNPIKNAPNKSGGSTEQVGALKCTIDDHVDHLFEAFNEHRENYGIPRLQPPSRLHEKIKAVTAYLYEQDDENGETDDNPEADDFEQVEPEDPNRPFNREWVR